ncbi:hypothetical protein [Kutzneria sp. NPDC051319]|uniref:hypothetical protein n=1 Tax=Kutzneria sp. NPDC051319 TaxID=3155047 RepID=UPI0034128D39
MRKLLCGTAVVAAMLATVGVGPAQAESAPGCSSTVQIGSTAYRSYLGQVVASVKQFKGCGQNWGYIYVWQSFVDGKLPFYLEAGVAVFDSPTHRQPDRYLGLTRGKVGQRELWSTGADTLSACTAAYGLISISGADDHDTLTSIRC